MNEKGKISTAYTWPVIILVLFLFWPVGVYLMAKRLSLNGSMDTEPDKLIKGLGIAAYSIALMILIFGFMGRYASICVLIALIFGLAGFLLIKAYNEVCKEYEDTKKYISLIVNGRVRSLDNIASSMGKPYDEVKNDIQKLISKGYLKNAYINESTREVILPDGNMANEPIENVSDNKASAEGRVITCKCCGANNNVVGDTGECEYCGALLK